MASKKSANTSPPEFDWILHDRSGKVSKPISTFTPEAVGKIEVVSSTGVAVSVRVKLHFGDETEVEIVVPLSELDRIDWFEKDVRCLINPNYRKAKEYLANIIRHDLAALTSNEVEKRYLLDHTGVREIGGYIVFRAGDRTIIRSSDEAILPKFELAELPFKFDIDTDRYPPQAAFDGMKELVGINVEIGRPLLAHALSALMRSAYIAAGVTPRTTLEIVGTSGKFKSVYSATLTQLYNRAAGVEPTTRMNSSDRFVEELLYEHCECTIVLDDRCTVGSARFGEKTMVRRKRSCDA